MAAVNCLAYRGSDTVIKPQYAPAPAGADRGTKPHIATEVGQHQMWAAQFYGISTTRTTG